MCLVCIFNTLINGDITFNIIRIQNYFLFAFESLYKLASRIEEQKEGKSIPNLYLLGNDHCPWLVCITSPVLECIVESEIFGEWQGSYISCVPLGVRFVMAGKAK